MSSNKFISILIISVCVVNGKPNSQNIENLNKNQKVIEEYTFALQDSYTPRAGACEDFDSYTCGYWRSVVGTLGEIKYEVDDNIHRLFNDYNATIKTKFDAGNKAKLIYDSCNEYREDENNYIKLKDILKQIASFPQYENEWASSKFDYLDVIIKMASYGVHSLIEFKTVPSYSKPEEYVLWIAPLILTDISNDSMKPDTNPYEFSQDSFSDIFDFQKEIIKTPSPSSKSIQSDTEEMTYAEFKRKIPEFDWDKYLKGVFGDSLQDTDLLVISNENYLNYTVNLFKSAEPKVLANFLMYQFIKDFFEIITGYDSSECTTLLGKVMPDVINALYLQTKHHQLHELELTELFSELKYSFLDLVLQAEWLDEKTRTGIADKVSKIEPILGYHGNKTNPAELDARYKSLEIEPNNFLEIIKRISERFNKLTMENLKTQNKALLPETFDPLQVNAGYMEGENRVIFYTGLAHEHVYHPAYPKAVNFGGYGTFMGHELAHSIDPQLRIFDKQGYRHEWWGSSSITEYNKRVECLIQQYNDLLESSQVKNSGLETLQENFADNVGLRIALNAYKKWLQKNKDNQEVLEKEKLSGFNFTEMQLFFVAFGKFRCNASGYIRSSVLSGYSPSKYRIQGCLQNNDEFSKAFSCPAGSVYNPERKCVIL